MPGLDDKLQPPNVRVRRRLPCGAEWLGDGGTHFRVWAPHTRRVRVVDAQDGRTLVELEPEAGGYHAGLCAEARPGTLYRLQLDDAEPLPDPASRFQPEGPHGPSEVVDPGEFEWTDAAWPGLAPQRQVLYEMHVGTFTREGTYAAAATQLEHLKTLGITAIELMPVHEFNGPFSWGYDGVNLFAPTRLYGRPDELRRFVDSAHAAGIGVILDVVYNHLGPIGNYLAMFSRDYFSAKHQTEWGDAINFDGPGSSAVREFFIANAGYWISEFHFDGLRFDATQCIYDDGPRHVLGDMARKAREAAGRRKVFLVAENEPQRARTVRPPAQGGDGLDALWNDDFHHSAFAAATGYAEAYYSETRGTPQELISALKWGFLYQGQWYDWQKQPRGTPAMDLPSRAFVLFLENHDQVANSLRGKRLRERTSPGRLRALTALLLLAPGTPMLFQGQEWGASTPFTYFANHGEEVDGMVRQGRRDFLGQFRHIAGEGADGVLVAPDDAAAFERCKLDHAEREREPHAGLLAMHRDLLKLRREDRVFAAQDGTRLHGAVLAAEAFCLRLIGDGGDDRLILVNLGTTLEMRPMPEPLLAPPEGRRWRLLWTSEHPAYGGDGMGEPTRDKPWHLQPHSLAVLTAGRKDAGG